MSIDEQIEAIKKVTPEQLRAFHSNFVGAQDADIALVGDFDTDQMQKVLEQTLGNWNAKVDYERIATTASDVESINKFVDTPDKAGAAFGAMTQIPLSDSHPDYPALVVANHIFGGGFLNSRLATRLRQEEGLSYGAGAFINASSRDEKATFIAYAICAPENLAKVETGFKEEFEKVIEEGFTQDELDAAVKGMVQNRRIDRAKDSRLVGTLAGNLDLDRSMQWDKEFELAIKSLTVDDINQAFRQHLSLDKISIVKAGDKAKAE